MKRSRLAALVLLVAAAAIAQNATSPGPGDPISPGYVAGADAGFHNISASGAFAGTAGTFSGYVSGQDAGLHNVVQSGDHFVSGYSGIQDAGANHVVASGTVSAARLEFLGGGTPGFERGGNAIVQTSSGDNLAVLGTAGNSGSQSSWYVYASVNNPASGGDCSGRLSDFCINDDLAIASGGTTGATISGAGVAVFNTSVRVAFTTIGTCAAGVEGALRLDTASGIATGQATRLCMCRSAGASDYAWINVITGTVGNATTCNP